MAVDKGSDSEVRGDDARIRRLGGQSDLFGVVACLMFVGVLVIDANSPHLHTVIPFVAAFVLCLACSIAAVASGHIARALGRQSVQTGPRQATFGLVSGYVCIVLLLVTLPITLFILAYLGCQSQGVGACS